jgi:proteasome assembly chaperone (PAC2) family protein
MVDEEIDVEALKQRAKQMIEYIVDQIERGKRLGADFIEVEGMLLGATMMVDSGNYQDAFELINECSQSAGQRIIEYENLTRTVKKAEIEITKARDNGQDVGEAARLLGLARTQMEEGNYGMAVSHANNSIEALAPKKDTEIAWGSGL